MRRALALAFVLAAACGGEEPPADDAAVPCVASGVYDCACTVESSTCKDPVAGTQTTGTESTYPRSLCLGTPRTNETGWLNLDGKGSAGCWLNVTYTAWYKGPETVYSYRQAEVRCAGVAPCKFKMACWCS